MASSSPSSTRPAPGLVDTSAAIKTGSQHSAERWFRETNQNVRHNRTSSLVPDDPPFYFPGRDPSDDDVSARAVPSEGSLHDSILAHHSRPRSPNRASSDDSSEGFRSIIDDLTVQNKRMRLRLRRYEQRSYRHLQDDRLFEVRVYGLTPAKKLELEETLRSFALRLGAGTPPTSSSCDSQLPRRAADTRPSLHPSSVSTNHSRPHDSAYASMSASGAGVRHGSEPGRFSQHVGTKEHQLQSHLSDVPAGLRPQTSSVMTEVVKQALVVQKLEQLFTEQSPERKDHVQGPQLHPPQPEMPRSATEARGPRDAGEGLREARMWPATGASAGPVADSMDLALALSAGGVGPGLADVGPEQRPTRLLDLDQSRTTRPADSLGYIRHLGLSPTGADDESVGDGSSGWIYLNLLTNMAQLHTINVTQEFVRKALVDCRSRLKLSSDGRKVRWEGSLERSHAGSDLDHTKGLSSRKLRAADDAEYLASHKRRKTHHGLPILRRPQMESESDDASEAHAARHTPAASNGERNARRAMAPLTVQHVDEPTIPYHPLFPRAHYPDDGEAWDELVEDSVMSWDAGDERTGAPVTSRSGVAAASERRSSQSRDRARLGGPLTFYQKVMFCTDLSGDIRYSAPPPYEVLAVAVIGQPSVGTTSGPEEALENRLQGWDKVIDEAEDQAWMDKVGMIAGMTSPVIADSGDPDSLTKASLVRLEASGVGGVRPMDNFAVVVDTRLARIQHTPTRPTAAHVRILSTARSDALVRSQKHCTPLVTEVLRSRMIPLPPAALPEATMLLSLSSSDDGLQSSWASSSDNPAAKASGSGSSDVDVRASHASAMRPATKHSHPSCSTSDPAPDGSSSSIDFLAAARELDPETIAERESEFDRHVAPLFAEELPAGSSAATVGGGSGFSSEDLGTSSTDSNSTEE
ncbi:MAG: hypothetical protein M1838_003453 [Thelocarpon superellum]|nr:MAG: hypothetical protein M1838_003453 [Thelocarpon superellum]